MEGKGVRLPAMATNATDSPMDESPGVDATGNEPPEPATEQTSDPTAYERGIARTPPGRMTRTEEGDLGSRGTTGLERDRSKGHPEPTPPTADRPYFTKGRETGAGPTRKGREGEVA